MEPIFGYNTKVELLVASVYYPILCAEDMTFNVRQDVVLATSRTTGSARKKVLRGLYDYTVTVSGLTKVSNADGQISFFYLLQASVRGSEQTIKLTFTDYDGNFQSITCQVIIPDLSITGPATAFSNSSITFEGTGEFEMNAVDPPPLDTDDEVFADWWETVEGQTFVELGVVPSGVEGYVVPGDVTILLVTRETDQYDVILTGTPGNRQARWNSSNQTMSFLNAFNAGETIGVEWKVTV